MNNNEIITKIFNNKKVLFIIPNLIYINYFLFIYNQNCGIDGQEYGMLFKEMCLYIIIYFTIHLIVHLILNKCIKKKKIICLIEILLSILLISTTYKVALNLYITTIVLPIVLIVNILFIIHLVKKIPLKKINIRINILNYTIIMSYILIIIFGFNLVSTLKNGITILIKAESYNKIKNIEVTKMDNNPNIYWIHCDGMLGVNAIKKYFDYKDTYLLDYLNANNYYINEDATLVTAHRTQHSLVALLNPDYYDEFHKDYLIEFEKTITGKQKSPSFIVENKNLTEKRLNNELMNALEKNNYTTFSITEYNQYSSIYADQMFDYYDQNNALDSRLEKIKYMTKENNSLNELKEYIDYVHLASLPSIFADYLKKINFLDYEEIPYNDIDISKYSFINETDYLPAKMILKSLNMSMDIQENNRFTFVDFPLNHLPIKFDSSGNRISGNDDSNLNYYLENYEYSSSILIDILNFIKDHDKEAVIIVQADHGIHNVEEEIMMKQLNITKEEVPTIRNSVISAIYIPEQYKNGEEQYLNNPLNISRYLVNNFVGENYEYIVE